MSRSERCAAAECERWGSQKQTKKSDREGERERDRQRETSTVWLYGKVDGDVERKP